MAAIIGLDDASIAKACEEAAEGQGRFSGKL
ncbi:malonyl CoA-acyl carrier protein transacylase [Escherichia coli]|uniref:Malonyl CoA-acyl carrier protein transacylase n=1 Tax=Escherichia coli TaxID=562 RepID=A0A376KW54_ECOLX|nr:malonyl CoA-acyl carrier protein transacylase [Escherichia coli]